MKYIKTYESISQDDIKGTVKDIVSELFDLGYDIDVTEGAGDLDPDLLNVYITGNPSIDINEISDTIIHLYSYMKTHQSIYKGSPEKSLAKNSEDGEYRHIGWGQLDKRNKDAFRDLLQYRIYGIFIQWRKKKSF